MAITPLNHHYAIENPASIYDEEALTALELAGRTTAKVNETIAAFNKLEGDTNLHLSKQDKEIERQLNEVIPETVEEYQNDLIENGTFDRAIDLYAGNLESRVDNLLSNVGEGSTTRDAELIDIRTAMDGLVYQTAGEAVRTMDLQIRNALDHSAYGNYYLPLPFEQGTIDTSTGALADNPNRIRGRKFNPCSAGPYKATITEGFRLCFIYYDANQNVIGYEWATHGCVVNTNPKGDYFKVLGARVGNTEIQPNDGGNFMLTRAAFYNEGDFVQNLSSLVKSSHTIVDDSDVQTAHAYPTGWRIFINTPEIKGYSDKPVPANCIIKKVAFGCSEARGSLTVEFWKRNGATITLDHERIIGNIEGDVIIDPNYKTKGETYVALKLTDTVNTVKYLQTSNANHYFGVMQDTTRTTFGVAEIGVYEGMSVGGVIEYDSYVFENETNNVITVGVGGMFPEIQAALSSIKDPSTPHVIKVLPRKTPYERFTMVGLFDSLPHISIVGEDKEHCVIQSNLGNYHEPPAEIKTNGIFKNLTFVSTHANQDANAPRGSYAVHIDYDPGENGCKITFEDCDFISDNAPAAGIGLWKNMTLKFRDCEFYGTGDPSYVPFDGYENTVNFGAFFCHSSYIVGATNQNLILDNCRIIGTNCKAATISVTPEFDSSDSDMTVTAYHNVLFSRNGSKNDINASGEITIDAASFGNNISALNGG